MSNWETEFMADVASLKLPGDVERLGVAEDLNLAITIAQSGDVGLLQLVADWLEKVNAEVCEYILCDKKIRVN